jgi:hypothetical protein
MSGAKALPFTLAQNKGTGEDMKKTVIITLTAVSAIVVIATSSTQKATAVPTTTQRTTTTTTRQTTNTAPKPQTQPPKPVYTETDYAEIVAAVQAYAESKTLPFIWDTKLTYEYARSGMAGYHDVVSLSRSSGKAFVINELKYNADQTEWLVAGGNGGVSGNAVYYNVVYFDYRGDTMFVLLYT